MTFKLIDRDKLIECLHEKFHAYELDEGISKGIDIAMGVVNEQSLVFARESEKDKRIAELEKAFDSACAHLASANYCPIKAYCIDEKGNNCYKCWKESILSEVSEDDA